MSATPPDFYRTVWIGPFRDGFLVCSKCGALVWPDPDATVDVHYESHLPAPALEAVQVPEGSMIVLTGVDEGDGNPQAIGSVLADELGRVLGHDRFVVVTLAPNASLEAWGPHVDLAAKARELLDGPRLRGGGIGTVTFREAISSGPDGVVTFETSGPSEETLKPEGGPADT